MEFKVYDILRCLFIIMFVIQLSSVIYVSCYSPED